MKLKKWLSLLLVMVLLASIIPQTGSVVSAAEAKDAVEVTELEVEDPVEEATKSETETTEPTVEEPEATDPVEETTKPTPGTTEPTVEESEVTELEEVDLSEEVKTPENVETPEGPETLDDAGKPDSSETVETEEVRFNTGNCEYSVVNKEAFFDLEMGDAFFEDDGSYTIHIPEENPFFPYEVQFTYNGEVISEWFMTPDDTVEVGGHRFGVSASFNGPALTRMNLEVAGNSVTVYPEKKEFTNDGGAATMSLIPLESRSLTVDLTGYTPLELTMVNLKAIFADEDISGSTKVSWKEAYSSGDNYVVTGVNDMVDLSWDTCYGGTNAWEMIVGDGDQLNPDNIRYQLWVDTTQSEDWLTAQVYTQDGQGNRSVATVVRNRYYDYLDDSITESRALTTAISSRVSYDTDKYAGLSINAEAYTKSGIGSVRVVEGSYHTAAEAVSALASYDVTSKVMCADMTAASAGYRLEEYEDASLTMIGYDAAGTVIGVLPIDWELQGVDDSVSVRLYDRTNGDSTQIGSSHTVYENGEYINFLLGDSYALNGTYSLVISYTKRSDERYPGVTAVYAGRYATIAEATAAGAVNIKDSVLGDASSVEGYAADYSQGVWFTVFAGEDGNANQMVYSFFARTKRAINDPYLSSESDIYFYGLADTEGRDVPAYVISSSDDSYAEKNYVTILVKEDVDLSKQYAPLFRVYSNETVYAEGSSVPEVSGKSLHSFAGGAIQYSVSAENGENSKNYWVQIKKAKSGNGQLYISSLADRDANTRVENGITYSTREVMLDSYHNDIHDICFANIGTGEIPALSAELSSDVVEMDEYWTLTGKQSLAGLSTVSTPSYDSGLEGELPNLAKVRLRAKDGVANGTEVSGTLTIKSGNTTLMVLTLTGMVGDPCITTTDIPDAVKYVPYGTMIQNSNKYSWIQGAYSLMDGDLPAGMVIKPNGELYGVPKETGTFTFTVRVRFTSTKENYHFPTQEAELTLTVKENTNDNVYYETDAEEGYTLLTPIGIETVAGSHDFYLEEITDSLFVSEGLYNGFIDLWLNGEKLERGVDYTAESGSTRITVRAQTLQNQALPSGYNTIAAEFRTDGDLNNDLRRTAQNFRLDMGGSDDSGNNDSGNSNSGNSASDSSSSGSGNSAGGSGTDAGITLSGYVVDKSGNPLAGITMELHSTPRITVTDANGYFQFSNVEFGTHTLFAKDAAGNILASRSIELRKSSTVMLSGDVLSAPGGASVQVTVVVADGAMNLFNAVLISSPATGDDSAPMVWALMLALSCAALAGVGIYRKRKEFTK